MLNYLIRLTHYNLWANRKMVSMIKNVKPEDIDDLEAARMAREIAKQIEETMQYPGQIKVNVMRETRSIEFAK